MSVISFLAVLLAIGFVVVGLVGFFGWRARMRHGGNQPVQWTLWRVAIVTVFPVLAGIEFFSCR